MFIKKGAPLGHQLTWSHYCELLWYDVTKIQYYIHICESNNLSVRELRQRIKNKEYEKSQPMADQLSRNNYCEIMLFNDNNKL